MHDLYNLLIDPIFRIIFYPINLLGFTFRIVDVCVFLFMASILGAFLHAIFHHDNTV